MKPLEYRMIDIIKDYLEEKIQCLIFDLKETRNELKNEIVKLRVDFEKHEENHDKLMKKYEVNEKHEENHDKLMKKYEVHGEKINKIEKHQYKLMYLIALVSGAIGYIFGIKL